MGAMMWRELRDRAHWIEIAPSKFDTMVRFIRTWSGKEDEEERKEDKRRFVWFRTLQHNAENFNFNVRVMTFVYEAEVIKSSCIIGDLENDVLLTTDIIMRLYIKDLEWLNSSVTSFMNSIKCHQGVSRNVLNVVSKDDVEIFINDPNTVLSET